MLDRAVQISEVEIAEDCQIASRKVEAGVYAERTLVALAGLLEAPASSIDDPQFIECRRMSGRKLQRRNVQLSLATSEKLSPEIVNQYMNVKARQIL